MEEIIRVNEKYILFKLRWDKKRRIGFVYYHKIMLYNHNKNKLYLQIILIVVFKGLYNICLLLGELGGLGRFFVLIIYFLYLL